jgi:hypothetical protein
MLGLLKRLLGLSSGDRSPASQGGSSGALASRREPSGSAEYFDLLQELQARKKTRDWEGVRDVAHRTLDLFPRFVSEMTGPKGYGLPPSIPMFPDGARGMAIMGDDEGLERLAKAATLHPALDDFKGVVEEAMLDRQHVSAIMDLIGDEPGVLQTEVSMRIGAEDARRVATLLRHMEEGGLIRRTKEKRSHSLTLVGHGVPMSHEAAALAREAEERRLREPAPPIAVVDPSHQKRRTLKPRELNLKNIEYVPLPRAPLRWEENRKETRPPETTEDFEVSHGWEVAEVEQLAMEDRPDTAFRVLAPHSAGAFMIDDLGNAARYPSVVSPKSHCPSGPFR